MMTPHQTTRRVILSLLTASVLLAGCGHMSGIKPGSKISRKPKSVTIARLDGKLRVAIRGELFTEYHYKEFAKPILYPVIGPHGIGMTRNWPLKKGVAGEAADHPHHKSLWFTHGSVNGVDFWGEGSKSGRIEHDKILKIESPAARAVIQTANKWLAPGDKVICTDTSTIAFAEVPGGRVIDYEITIHASHGAVTFGDTKEGTMGIRMNPALRLELGKRKNKVKGTGQAINSEGDRGKQLWGKRAKWVDYWAPINGKTVGVAIFDHPTNPRHPTWWHAREYGLVAANAFGLRHFEKKPPGTGDMTIKAGESVTFRYRFFFHEGDALQAKIAERYLLWAHAAAP